MNTVCGRTRTRRLGVSILALGLPFLSSCVVNPATGSRQLTLMTEGQEIQMGRDADPGIVASMGLYPDEELQAYVHDLGSRLAARSERPELPWTFRVLDDPLINAFALPGGYIYVTRGIMAYLDSEAELAGVLGHEIGHVTARHSVNQISRAQVAQLGLGIGMILKPELQRFQGLASSSLGLLFLKFGRDDEHQADELGVRYMSRVGYDPTQLSGVMEMLGRITAGSEGERAPEWLSTHPNPANREENILEMAAGADVALNPPLTERSSYLARLDGLVFGTNPREGFFEGSAFLHPEMAFRMDFPQGWATANTKSAVQGVSPQEDAVLQLTLAEGVDPPGALQAFLGRSGMEAGPTSRASIHGLPAASATFRFSGEGGEVRGRVSFVRHTETLFQLVGYSTPDAWRERSAGLQEAMESFRLLEDPALLQLQPARLRVTQVPRSMTLEDFLRGEGALEAVQDVRQLNRLEGNPTLERGRMMKIPVGGRGVPGR